MSIVCVDDDEVVVSFLSERPKRFLSNSFTFPASNKWSQSTSKLCARVTWPFLVSYNWDKPFCSMVNRWLLFELRRLDLDDDENDFQPLYSLELRVSTIIISSSSSPPSSLSLVNLIFCCCFRGNFIKIIRHLLSLKTSPHEPSETEWAHFWLSSIAYDFLDGCTWLLAAVGKVS